MSDEFKALVDEEARQRAAADPDAGTVPEGYWDGASASGPELQRQVTLQLDAEVLHYFRAGGTDFQSRINDVLKRYVRTRGDPGEVS